MEEQTTKGIMLFCQNLKDFCYLTDEQAGKVIKALANYFLNSVYPEDLEEPILQMVFAHLQENADWSTTKYQKICERNRKVSESRNKSRKRDTGETEENNTVTKRDHSSPDSPLVTSGHQWLPEITSGHQTAPESPVDAYNTIQSNSNKLNSIEVEVEVDREDNDTTNSDSDSDSNFSPSSDLQLTELREDCRPYLDTDEEDMTTNLQVLLRSFTPEEIKNAVVRSHSYHHSADWGYITTVCKNTRKEKELIRMHSR